jgi:hypothetical protein
VSRGPHFTITSHGFDAAVSTTSSATIVMTARFGASTATPELGLHGETSVTVPPRPAPVLTSPLVFEHAPFDLVLTAATAAAATGAIVAWHFRRSRLDEFFRL